MSKRGYLRDLARTHNPLCIGSGFVRHSPTPDLGNPTTRIWGAHDGEIGTSYQIAPVVLVQALRIQADAPEQ